MFGQLDVEAVHSYWNIGFWLGTGALLYRYGLRNVWLTVAVRFERLVQGWPAERCL